MKIGNAGSTPNIQPEIPSRKPKADGTAPVAQDRVRTSDTALVLSRNAAELKAQLQPREEVLHKFDGMANTTLDLADATIDEVIDRMRHP